MIIINYLIAYQLFVESDDDTLHLIDSFICLLIQ